MLASDMVALGARVPVKLKNNVMTYCDRNGIKLRFFVTQALEEKLREEQETRDDNAIVDTRLKNAQYIGTEELTKYISSRKKQA
ncbi:MAG: hypothetical protein HQL25_02030 [Candidatus Omnitrophica bacterium]|nr:hypothetical protein [Candidatus Omnitrophota bacterium]